jgi:hypothetical protein
MNTDTRELEHKLIEEWNARRDEVREILSHWARNGRSGEDVFNGDIASDIRSYVSHLLSCYDPGWDWGITGMSDDDDYREAVVLLVNTALKQDPNREKRW